MQIADFMGKTLADAQRVGDALVLTLATGERGRIALGNLAADDTVIFGIEGDLANLVGPPIAWTEIEIEGPVSNNTVTSFWATIRLATVLGSVKVLLTAAQTGEERPEPAFTIERIEDEKA